MKIIKILLHLAVIAGPSVVLISTRPYEKEFADWYVEKNEDTLRSIFTEAYINIVEQRTETTDYLVFSVFELDGKERYVGILG